MNYKKKYKDFLFSKLNKYDYDSDYAIIIYY